LPFRVLKHWTKIRRLYLFSNVITEELGHGPDSGFDGGSRASFSGHQLGDLQGVGDGAPAGQDGVTSNLK
jgi:hypothetical protein